MPCKKQFWLQKISEAQPKLALRKAASQSLAKSTSKQHNTHPMGTKVQKLDNLNGV